MLRISTSEYQGAMNILNSLTKILKILVKEEDLDSWPVGHSFHTSYYLLCSSRAVVTAGLGVVNVLQKWQTRLVRDEMVGWTASRPIQCPDHRSKLSTVPSIMHWPTQLKIIFRLHWWGSWFLLCSKVMKAGFISGVNECDQEGFNKRHNFIMKTILVWMPSQFKVVACQLPGLIASA